VPLFRSMSHSRQRSLRASVSAKCNSHPYPLGEGVAARSCGGFKPAKTNDMGNSKRKTLNALPNDWREKGWLLIDDRAHPKLRTVVALLWLTGLRPAELQTGVTIVQLDSDHLGILLRGVKTKDAGGRERGHARRSYVFNIESEPAAWLFNQCIEPAIKNRRQLQFFSNAGTIYNQICQLFIHVLPNLRQRVSPYCFRHQLAADLKAGNIDRELIAKTLGHLSDFSQSKYGRRRNGGRGSVVPIAVKTSSAVIRSPKADPLARFKKRKSKTPLSPKPG
jgi:integrase